MVSLVVLPLDVLNLCVLQETVPLKKERPQILHVYPSDIYPSLMPLYVRHPIHYFGIRDVTFPIGILLTAIVVVVVL